MNIDKAAFIGMETEHSNDTAGEIWEQNHKTIDVASVRDFSRVQQSQNQNIRTTAYKKQ